MFALRCVAPGIGVEEVISSATASGPPGPGGPEAVADEMTSSTPIPGATQRNANIPYAPALGWSRLPCHGGHADDRRVRPGEEVPGQRDRRRNRGGLRKTRRGLWRMDR